MGSYILRRILISIPVIFMITIIVFSLVEIAPGDMLDFFLTDDAIANMTEKDIFEMREKLGLNDPPPIRYIKWLGKVVQGDLGFSLVEKEPVAEILVRRMNNSLILMGTGLIISIIVGIPLGVFLARHQYSFWDFSLTGLSFVALSMPAFVAGIVGMYFFAIKIPIFPAGGMYSPIGSRGLGDLLYHLILPAFILSMMYIARNMRYTRFSMLDVLNQDYVTTARAKGMKERVVVYRHALRNALIPVVTVIGLSIPMVIVGAVFLETIFNWPGMGRLYYKAVLARDFPIVMGANLFIAVIVLVSNLVVDIVYSIIDPRVRLS
ncbi:MAG: ABC transporter permease [Bacteroidetes bacterium]|nr:ABC transporter permease [Bacteroidota bacterium]